MKEYIVPVNNTDRDEEEIFIGFIRKRKELIRCKDCRHIVCTASIEHNDGEVTKYYMCNYWHRPTDPEGFCHIAKRARYDSD